MKLLLEDESSASRVWLALGILLIVIALVAVVINEWQSSLQSSVVLSIGIVLLLMFAYDLYTPSTGLHYFILGFFGVLGITALVLQNTTLSVPIEGEVHTVWPVLPIYISLLGFRFSTFVHDKLIGSYDTDRDNQTRGYLASLDAAILLASLIIVIQVVSQFTNISPASISREWIEGFYISVVVLLSLLSTRRSLQHERWSYKMNFMVLFGAGVALILIPATKFAFSGAEITVSEGIPVIIHAVIGVALVYFSKKLYHTKSPK